MIPKLTYLKIFANCLLVKGKNRSLIVDIQKDFFTMIPDSMHEVIEQFQDKKSIAEIYETYGIENTEIINEYITFILENEFGFLTDYDEFDMFPDIDKHFEFPSEISNCIIEISESNILHFQKIMNEIIRINCKNIQLVSYEQIEIKSLIEILKSIESKRLHSIELVLKNSDKILENIEHIINSNNSIKILTIHSSNNLEYETKIINNCIVSFITNEIKSIHHCGTIDTSYFNVNKDKVLESINFNSCLYKKVSIDMDGQIKNCPAMRESFGNIKNTSLKESLNNSNFKKYWNINKDKIDVCKDCEFRHICTDCRAYIEDPNNQYSKPLKCGYDPYTNKWEEWSTNPLKQKVIEYYGMKELIKKDA